jgi:hypothetical protein
LAKAGARLKENDRFADMLHMKPHIARLVCALLFSSIAATSLQAQGFDESGAQTKILALEHAWNQAEELKDLKALDAIFDNSLVYVDVDGTLMTKAEFLARVKSELLQQVVTESMTVQIFQRTAIVTGVYRSHETKNGKPFLRRGRFVDTWVFRDGIWLCVAAQSTPILN